MLAEPDNAQSGHDTTARQRSKQKIEVLFAGLPVEEAPEELLRKMQIEVLNEVRRIHGLPPLVKEK